MNGFRRTGCYPIKTARHDPKDRVGIDFDSERTQTGPTRDKDQELNRASDVERET